MSAPLDLDELIASGEIEADPLAMRRARLAVLEREALAAFRVDPSYAIEMAKASWVAREKEDSRGGSSQSR